jgi:hypothetical protein
LNWASCLVWGFAATAVLTTLMAGSEGFGITRMNIPHMLGTMFTPNRDRAKVYGAGLHFLNGWAFSIAYVAAFHAAHIFTWWFGALLGILHGAFVAAVALPVMPGVHPRMASELRGPTVARQLEPPGFMALNYGARTPISILIAHLAFGAMLGGFYSPSGDRSRSVSLPAVSLSAPFDGKQTPTASSGSSPATAPASPAANANANPHSNRSSIPLGRCERNNSSSTGASPGGVRKPHLRASPLATWTVMLVRPSAATARSIGPPGAIS